MKNGLKKGFIHLYTGDGKGKTTAAMGLALRAAGAGLKVFIAQFAKGVATSEAKAMKKFSKQIRVKQFGARTFIKRNPTARDRVFAAKGLTAVEKALREGNYDVVILDEVCVACRYDLIPVRKVLAVIKKRPREVEVVLTGRNAPNTFVKAADIVTEMREVKHYFSKGVMARKGIEY
jgi:cob(I)alamin adenosyltransferase